MTEMMNQQKVTDNDQPPKNVRIFGKTTSKLIVSAAIFGVVFSYLFTRQTDGLNILILVLVLYGFAYYNRDMFVKRTLKQEPAIYLFSVPAIFLASSLFFERTAIDGLSMFIILMILLTQYLVISQNARHQWYQPFFLIDMFFGGINRVMLGMGYFFSGTVNSLFKERSKKKKGVAIGIAVGVALLIITVPFLLTADRQISKLFAVLLNNIDFGTVILFLFLFVFGAALVTGPIATAQFGEFAGRGEKRDRTDFRPIQPSTTAIALSMIAIVYVLFGAVQFQYFFLPREMLDSALGLTSSAYAVQGFGELVYITCLNVVLIGGAMRLTKQKDGKTQPYIKVLYTLLIVFNFVILASSHLRMQCYEASFGYTTARFLSHGFMALLLVLNVLMLVRIYHSRFKAAKWFVVAALVYYCAIVAINPDLFVARRNIDRYEQEEKIDTAYMFTLSSSAVSEACDFVAEYPDTFDAPARERAERTLSRYAHQSDRGWQSLNIADITAQQKLEKVLGQ